MRVRTLRLPKVGRLWPATIRLPPSVLLSTSIARTISLSKVTRGFIFTMTPTGR